MESIVLPIIPLTASSFNSGLRRRSPKPPASIPPLRSRSSFVTARCFRNPGAPSSGEPLSISFAGSMRWPPPTSRVLASITCSAASSGGGGDGLGAGGGGEGGGDGGRSAGETEARSLIGELEEASVLESEVIILTVGGMSCGGCVASVKRILESQPQVATATVNLENETAVIWVSPDAKIVENWQKQLGEKLANHLTTCGFQSSLKANRVHRTGPLAIQATRTQDLGQRLRKEKMAPPVAPATDGPRLSARPEQMGEEILPPT